MVIYGNEVGTTMIDVFLETLLDSAKTLPFLFIAYLLIEYLEHKAGGKFAAFLREKGKLAPIIGGVIGIVPQCGFSVAAANLYAGGIISAGTLIAVFLSTSDEALPVLIASGANAGTILKLIGAKLVIAIFAGLVIDVLFRRLKLEKKYDPENQELCKDCHCEEDSIFSSALRHTAQIFIFILLLNLVLNLAIFFLGEATIAKVLSGKGLLQVLIIGLIGLIPNCAPSVVITELFVSGVLSFGSALAGLLCASGMGLAVLFKVNKDKKQNILIISIVYLVGVLFGFLINSMNL